MHRSQRGASATRRLLPACAALLLAGCASPGPPRAPSLRLPEVVADLAAQRIGDSVVLTWRTPAQTTDGDPIRGPLTAQICREMPADKPGSRSAAGNAPACQIVLRQAAAPGLSRAQLTLAPALLAAPPALETYRIEIENAASHSAGPSGEAYAAGGTAPAPLGELQAVSRREGALLTWAPVASPQTGMPDRVQVTRLAKLSASAAPRPAGQQGKTGNSKQAPATLEAPPAATDSGGLLDRGVREARAANQQYTYIAQRVRTLTLDGHALEVRGLPSAPVDFLYKDTFAAAAPTGLVAIPAGDGLSVDLAWETNPETDLEGYNIYRRAGTGPFVRLNPAPLAVPAFRDVHLSAGVRYTWRVTAVRAGGLESAPGAEASEQITR